MTKKPVAKKKPKVKPAKIPAHVLSGIALAVAKSMQHPQAFTRRGLSFDASGKPASVFGTDAVQRDALGWVLKHTYDRAPAILHFERKKMELAYQVAKILNAEVMILAGRSLVTVSDEEGAKAVASILAKIAGSLKEQDR